MEFNSEIILIYWEMKVNYILVLIKLDSLQYVMMCKSEMLTIAL